MNRKLITGLLACLLVFSGRMAGFSPWISAVELSFGKGLMTGSGSTRTLYYFNSDEDITGMKAAVWSKENAQDDLVWYTMTKGPNNIWAARISLSTLDHAGDCDVHIYTDQNEFIKAVNFTVPAEDVENAVNPKIHTCAKAILDEIGYDLRSVYDWTLSTLTYQELVTPITVPKEGPYAGLNRQELYFIYAFENHMGNCFCYAATVYWLARELGYTVRLIEGRVRLPSGNLGPHSWVEIDLDGATYILDPESEKELEEDGYLQTYETGPSLTYYPDLPAY